MTEKGGDEKTAADAYRLMQAEEILKEAGYLPGPDGEWHPIKAGGKLYGGLEARVEEPVERVVELADGQWTTRGLEKGADLLEVADRIRRWGWQLRADADRIEAAAAEASKTDPRTG